MPTIIFTTTGDIRSIEFTENFSNTVPKILETPPYPEYFNDTSKLLDSVFSRFYDFSSEMAEIETMSFSLLEAPEESIADFNVLYARVQSLQSRCASILISINREKSEWQSLKSSAARVYKKVQNLIYVNDGICKTLKNQQLQQAYAEEKMPTIVRITDVIASVIPDLQMLEERVKIKLDELDKANTNLNRQQKITEDLIGLNHPVQPYRSLQIKTKIR